MANFAYVARDHEGQRITGTLAGASEQAILEELQARSLAPVEVREVLERRHWRRGVSGRRLANAYRQLGDLLHAGVPLLRALRLMGRSKADARLAGVMASVADAVADGERLADAMSAHREVFPPIQIAMVRAGERGGFLDQVLSRMGSFLEHQADLRSKVVGNMIYPAVLLVVALGIVVMALAVLVPKFQVFYAQIELPWPTRLLLGSSDLLTRHWLLVVIAIGVLGAAVTSMLRRPAVRRELSRWQLRVPKLGALIQSLAVARFSRIMGTLLGNGVPMLPAMQISRDAAGHPLLVEAIDEAAAAVRAGEPLAKPLFESGMFSADVAEMIAVGESANNLADVLLTIADTIEKRVDRMLTVLVRLLEPLLLLTLAGIVLFIFVALVVPMLRMSSSI